MEDIVKLISEYGYVSVVIAMFAFIALLIVKYLIDNHKKKSESQLKRQEEDARQEREDKREQQRTDTELLRMQHEDLRYDKLCDSINNMTVTLKNGRTHTVQEQDDDIAINLRIQSALNDLINLGASHAFYFVFHNGGTDVLGRGMLKMTMTVEACGPTQKSKMREWQGVPRSLIPVFYNELKDDGDYYVLNVEDIISKDFRTYSFVKDDGATSALFKAIRNEEGLILGFIGEGFVKQVTDFERAKVEISKKADLITGILIGSQIS